MSRFSRVSSPTRYRLMDPEAPTIRRECTRKSKRHEDADVVQEKLWYLNPKDAERIAFVPRGGDERMGFADIIGPVMIGPSSSHTAGAARLARLASACWGNEPLREVVVFLRGSFAFTSRGHGTDKAIVAGLLGMMPDDPGIRDALGIAAERGFPYRFDRDEIEGVHPNSARFLFTGCDGRTLEAVGASVGGGAVELQEIDGFRMQITGEFPTFVTFHRDTHGVVAAVAALMADRRINIASLTLHRKARGGLASLVAEIDHPGAPDETLRDAVAAAHPAILRVVELCTSGGN